MQIKQTCKGCRALESLSYCSLGYNTEKQSDTGATYNIKPLEPCPKPKTYSDYVYLSNLSIKRIDV